MIISLAENEELFKRLLAFHGPVTAAVDAVTWQDYLGGIIQYHCQDRINHAVSKYKHFKKKILKTIIKSYY